MNKFLSFIFYLLLIVLVAEGGFILYNKQKESMRSKDVPVPESQLKTVTVRDPLEERGSALNYTTLEKWLTVMRWYNKGVLHSSRIENDFRGKLVTIDQDGGKFEGGGDEYDGTAYAKSFVLRGDSGEINWFFFMQDSFDQKKVVVYEKTGDGEPAEIQMEDLKVNDMIEIHQEIELTNDFDSSSIAYEIYRINGSDSQPAN